jgi:plasmid stability protein
MAQILVRDLEPAVVERLKARARCHGRSLQAEVAQILREAARMYTPEEALALSETWHRRLAGKTFSDSADLIREDRER